MKIQSPKWVEGQVWIQKFNEHLRLWLASQRQDSTAFEDAISALRNLMEREPDTAGFVANTLSTLVRQHSDKLSPAEMEQAAKCGIEAIRLVSEETELRTLTHCNLLNYLACAHVDRGQFGKALEQLVASYSALNMVMPSANAIAELLYIQAYVLSGLAREALLDYEEALSDFVKAEEAAGKIVEDHQCLSNMLTAQNEFEFPGVGQLPQNIIHTQLQLLWRQLLGLRISAAAGAGRCAIMADPDSVNRRLTHISEVSEANGLGMTSVLELAPLVRTASPDVAKESVTRILKSVKKLGLETAEFAAVLYAALSTCMEDHREIEACQKKAKASIKKTKDPLIQAATLGLLLMSAGDEPIRENFAGEFLNLLDYLGRIRDNRLATPSYRMVFDEPILVVLQQLCERGKGLVPWVESKRTLIAKLIDYELSGLTPIDQWLDTEPMETKLESIAELARDRLARAHCALRNWPDTVVLIVRSINERTLFLALTGEASPIAVVSEKSYGVSARAIVNYLDMEISAVALTGAPRSVDQVMELGRKVYEALPDSVRTIVADCQQLLVCPDHREGGGAVPFELFHDGGEWLGVSKSIARFPNLRTLVRCLEGTTRRDKHRRLLSIAVPDAEGFQHLQFAKNEAEATRTLLEDWGWDAPSITAARVSPTYFLERLPYVTHLHIAAHGKATGQQEYLVFQEGKTLSAAELTGRFIPRMPTAYLNVCELGTSRWAGSGRTQSMPYAFVSAGSRAVIANLLPTEDKISSVMADLFYRNAQNLSFGDSLKEARRKLAGDEVHPVFWGSTVLIGDPSVSLMEHAMPQSVSEAYLDALILNTGGDDAREAAVKAARTSLLSDPEDTRLSASVALVREINEREFAPDHGELAEIAEACRIAFEIDHLPLLGLVIFTASKAIDRLRTKEAQIKFYDNAINLFESLEGESEPWKHMLDDLLVRWLRLQRGERMPQLRMHGSEPDDKDDFMQAANAIKDIQLAMEARDIRAGHGPVSREDESSVENVLWNAVVAGRDYQLEDMREIYDFARKLVDKLSRLGAIDGGAVEESTTAFAGLLHWIWGFQNQAQLVEDMIQGQSGVLNELLTSLRHPWQGTPWFEGLHQFDVEMKKLLDSLDRLPYYDKLCPRIEEVMTNIMESAETTLEDVRVHGRDIFCAATAWLLGCLIKHNTYSYTEGSVPKDLNEKLKDIQHHFNMNAKGDLYPWLDRGFKSVREAELDELRRWKYGLT